MISFDAIIFDFDGVLLESEYSLNTILAELLTQLGHHHSVEDALSHYVGLAGNDFIAAVEQRIGRPLPDEFHARMKQESMRAMKEGIAAVAGAVDFVRSLPPSLPKAVASSSSTRWIRAHLDHLGIADAFGEHVYSGREHVERGKPAPDIYLYATERLGADVRRSVIIEDFGGRRDRCAGLGRNGDRACGGQPLPRGPCRHAALARGAMCRA